MNFTQAEPTENYPISRLISENGIWEFGIHPTLFGFRVSANMVGEQYYSISYCCAGDAVWLIRVTAIVLAILEGLPETTQGWQAERLFPCQQRKPMVNDPECWDQLNKLAMPATEYEPLQVNLHGSSKETYGRMWGDRP